MEIKRQTNKLNIEEGTVTFWVKEDRVVWNDGKIYPLFELSEGGNSIFIVKDNDNKLKFFHVYLGKGRTDVECDVSNLEDNRKRFIAATWSIKDKKICLYVDGGEIQNCTQIKY